MKITPIVSTTDNLQLYGLQIKRGETSTIRVFIENGNASDVYLCAVRADFVETQRPGESDEIAINNGQELIDDDMIEAKIGAGEWASICGWANKLQIGPINEQEYVEVQLKSVIASDVKPTGTVYAGLAFRVAGTEADDSLLSAADGVTVSGGYFSELNQTYTFVSSGLLTASNGAYIQFNAFDGYWRMSNNAGTVGAYVKGGTINEIPSRGWKWMNRKLEMPRPIVLAAL